MERTCQVNILQANHERLIENGREKEKEIQAKDEEINRLRNCQDSHRMSVIYHNESRKCVSSMDVKLQSLNDNLQ